MLTLSEIEIRHVQVIFQQVLNRPLNRNNTIRQSRPLSGRTKTQTFKLLICFNYLRISYHIGMQGQKKS